MAMIVITAYSIGSPVTVSELETNYFEHFKVGDRVYSPIAEIYNYDQRCSSPAGIYRLPAGTICQIVGFGTYQNAGIRSGRQYALLRAPRQWWECMAPKDSVVYANRHGAQLINPVDVPLFVLKRANDDMP